MLKLIQIEEREKVSIKGMVMSYQATERLDRKGGISMRRRKDSFRWGLLFLFVLMGILFLSGCGLQEKQEASVRNSATGQEKKKTVSTEKQGEGAKDPQGNASATGKASGQNEEETGYTGKLTFSFAGDCTLASDDKQPSSVNFESVYEREGKGYFFRKVKDIFEADDLTVVNFEGTLTDATDKLPKKWNFKADPSFANILVLGKVDAVTLANNHSMDYQKEGLVDTQNALKHYDIAYAHDEKVAILKRKGIKIALVSLTTLLTSVHNGADMEGQIDRAMAKAKQKHADIILCCFHWGSEGAYQASGRQVQLAHYAIDKGADMVIGTHPHVLEGIGRYDGSYIAYSLGNFCFGGNTNPSDKDTMILQATFSFEDGALQKGETLKVIPCSISGKNASNDYQPHVLTGEKGQEVLDKVEALSHSYGIIIGKHGTVKK